VILGAPRRHRRRGREHGALVRRRAAVAGAAFGIFREPCAVRQDRRLAALALPDVVVHAAELLLHDLALVELRVVRRLVEETHLPATARADAAPVTTPPEQADKQR